MTYQRQLGAMIEGAETEREECAKLCDAYATTEQARADKGLNLLAAAEARAARALAAAIRKRGKEPAS